MKPNRSLLERAERMLGVVTFAAFSILPLYLWKMYCERFGIFTTPLASIISWSSFIPAFIIEGYWFRYFWKLCWAEPPPFDVLEVTATILRLAGALLLVVWIASFFLFPVIAYFAYFYYMHKTFWSVLFMAIPGAVACTALQAAWVTGIFWFSDKYWNKPSAFVVQR